MLLIFSPQDCDWKQPISPPVPHLRLVCRQVSVQLSLLQLWRFFLPNGLLWSVTLPHVLLSNNSPTWGISVSNNQSLDSLPPKRHHQRQKTWCVLTHCLCFFCYYQDLVCPSTHSWTTGAQAQVYALYTFSLFFFSYMCKVCHFIKTYLGFFCQIKPPFYYIREQRFAAYL